MVQLFGIEFQHINYMTWSWGHDSVFIQNFLQTKLPWISHKNLIDLQKKT